jgi:CheY-like chemotaxis protein
MLDPRKNICKKIKLILEQTLASSEEKANFLMFFCFSLSGYLIIMGKKNLDSPKIRNQKNEVPKRGPIMKKDRKPSLGETETDPGGFPSTISDLRVLIVDDVRANRQLLYHILKKEGFQTREAEDGKEGIRLFQEWAPHIILMDHLMPEMDGLETTRRIRALPEGKETLIFVITANVAGENRSAALEAGANAFIRKPFRKAELLEEIRKGLSLPEEML